MKIIKKLSDMIEDELRGAELYARCALKHKEENPALAKVFYDISLQEMTHVNLLHAEEVKIIEQYKKDGGESPAAMLAVYDYVHEKFIDWANRIKIMQSHYKEG